MLFLTILKIFTYQYIWATTLTFPGHMTSSVMWPFDLPYAISYWCPIGTEPAFNRFQDIWSQNTSM